MKYRIKSSITKWCLWVVVFLNKDSNYISHVKREVPEWFLEEDGPNKWIGDGTVELLAVLSSQGHSGSSIGFALQFFKTMALFKPWGPLTGDESEWVEVSPGMYQNRRCSSVFKEGGEAYNIDGKVFHDGDEIGYTSRDSRVPVTFPYVVPDKPEWIDTTA